MRRDSRWILVGVLVFLVTLAFSHGKSLMAADPTRRGAPDYWNGKHVKLACEEYEMDRQYDPGLERPEGCPVL